MRQVMVRYTVRPDRVEENERLVRAVYEELHRTPPEGFRYTTYRLDGGATFVHHARHEGAESPLPGLEAFRRFQEGLRDRCAEPPVVSQLTEVGSFRSAA